MLGSQLIWYALTVVQVRLLLYYASGDARLSVRLKAYKELLQLASRVPHTWTQEMIQVGVALGGMAKYPAVGNDRGVGFAIECLVLPQSHFILCREVVLLLNG